ncbi:hypothetical protein NDU88_000185 [Pleurodeles waltl]|uniref:Uncharacterized protein n=1 Tax=Pleurodeles waltl TaxID=8319 RepID=A0AAV7S8U7_PLEWA|nr:hypothetical protein NDU88_000185 [Pleurodeles waltl]
MECEVGEEPQASEAQLDKLRAHRECLLRAGNQELEGMQACKNWAPQLANSIRMAQLEGGPLSRKGLKGVSVSTEVNVLSPKKGLVHPPTPQQQFANVGMGGDSTKDKLGRSQ